MVSVALGSGVLGAERVKSHYSTAKSSVSTTPLSYAERGVVYLKS